MIEILEMTSQEVAAVVKREYERWQPVVRASGFTAED
jgi:tripartite-type tricarboxylate transporter receptor subunit TctC